MLGRAKPKGRCLKWSKGRTRCMKRAKSRRTTSKRRRSSKRRSSRSGGKKVCLTTKGKLKPGWRLAKGGRCVKAKGARR